MATNNTPADNTPLGSNPVDATPTTEVSRIVSMAAEAGDADVFSGKRGWARYTTGMRMEVKRNDTGVVWAVTLRNISGGGLAFRSTTELPQGTSISIREWSPDGTAVWLRAEINHCTVIIGGYLIGAQLADPAPTDWAQE